MLGKSGVDISPADIEHEKAGQHTLTEARIRPQQWHHPNTARTTPSTRRGSGSCAFNETQDIGNRITVRQANCSNHKPSTGFRLIARCQAGCM